MPIVAFQDVSRVYTSGDHELRALDHINMSLDEGSFVVILGPSGAGKSTLLNILGGLDSPTKGRVLVEGKGISALSGDAPAKYHTAIVGFVFQFYNLIPTLTAKGNVALVREIAPDAFPAEQMLDEVGLIILANSPLLFPAGSNSVYPLRGRWPKTQKSSYATSPPARWIQRPVLQF